MKIIKFEEKYRDDLIFMILEAKDTLGRVPGLNEDLLDIKKNYVREIKEKYPRVSDYLLSLGVDVEKTMETIPLEPD